MALCPISRLLSVPIQSAIAEQGRKYDAYKNKQIQSVRSILPISPRAEPMLSRECIVKFYLAATSVYFPMHQVYMVRYNISSMPSSEGYQQPCIAV